MIARNIVSVCVCARTRVLILSRAPVPLLCLLWCAVWSSHAHTLDIGLRGLVGWDAMIFLCPPRVRCGSVYRCGSRCPPSLRSVVHARLRSHNVTDIPAIWRALGFFRGPTCQRVRCLRFLWPEKRRDGLSSPLVLQQKHRDCQHAADIRSMFNLVSSGSNGTAVVPVVILQQHSSRRLQQ